MYEQNRYMSNGMHPDRERAMKPVPCFLFCRKVSFLQNKKTIMNTGAHAFYKGAAFRISIGLIREIKVSRDKNKY